MRWTRISRLGNQSWKEVDIYAAMHTIRKKWWYPTTSEFVMTLSLHWVQGADVDVLMQILSTHECLRACMLTLKCDNNWRCTLDSDKIWLYPLIAFAFFFLSKLQNGVLGKHWWHFINSELIPKITSFVCLHAC
jgi:hypothetical protein